MGWLPVTTEMNDIGTRMREAFEGLNMQAAIRLVFGKCPKCGERLVRGQWLQFCPDRSCQRYIGVLNKELGRTVEYVAPKTDAERDWLAEHRFEVAS